MKVIQNANLTSYKEFVFLVGKKSRIRTVVVSGHWAPAGDCTLIITGSLTPIPTAPSTHIDAFIKMKVTFLVAADPEQTFPCYYKFDLRDEDVIAERDTVSIGIAETAGGGGNMQVILIYDKN